KSETFSKAPIARAKLEGLIRSACNREVLSIMVVGRAGWTWQLRCKWEPHAREGLRRLPTRRQTRLHERRLNSSVRLPSARPGPRPGGLGGYMEWINLCRLENISLLLRSLWA